jgi:hypothetical protein
MGKRFEKMGKRSFPWSKEQAPAKAAPKKAAPKKTKAAPKKEASKGIFGAKK